MTRSDALQNLTESIFAAGVLAPGVWCVAHGRALRFPGVVKNAQRGTFSRSGTETAPGEGGKPHKDGLDEPSSGPHGMRAGG
jgi:hypothetical protein